MLFLHRPAFYSGCSTCISKHLIFPSSSTEFLQISSGIGQNSALGAGPQSKEFVKDEANKGSTVLDSNEEQIRIDKSNILLLGPTGSGICCFLIAYFKLALIGYFKLI